MINYLEIKNQFAEEMQNCRTAEELQKLKIKYLSRKGIIAALFKEMANQPPAERPKYGMALNQVKLKIEAHIENKQKEQSFTTAKEKFFDATLPADEYKYTTPHPIKIVLNEIIEIFTSMGFGVAYGPDIETNYYNFTALNMPDGHPARDMHDTFYLQADNLLLRTHTSPVQIRMMEKHSPPYQFIAPGKCYRRDTIDTSHSPVFHQVEGLMVNEKVNFSNLKGVLSEFASLFFQNNIRTRFRPSFFPFTEPSAEMDIRCTICKGSGCPSCSGKGWLEILGAGMVDPEVFKICSIDSDTWQGFAFGMGVERLAMLKYSITDMRLFYQNDIRFLEQF